MKTNNIILPIAACMLLSTSLPTFAQDTADSSTAQEPASSEEVIKPGEASEGSERFRDKLREDLRDTGENPHSRLPYRSVNPDEISKLAAKEREQSKDLFPLFRERAIENGTVLPFPYGLSVVGTHYVEDLELDKLTIKRRGKPNIVIKDESVLVPEDLSLYNVSFRVDAWILPYMNVYALLGRTQVDFDLEVDLNFEIDGVKVDYQNTFDFEAGRNSYTVGTILAYGLGNWFGMVDLRYAQTDFSLSTTGPQTYTTIARVGWNGRIGPLKGMLWAGALKQEVDFALTTNSDEVELIPRRLDVTEIDIRFGSRHGYTPMIGSRWDMDSHWSLAVEYSFLDREYFNAVMMFRY
ncbi:MAG: hypothetical protein AAGF35_09315 [Pseudomonadota bacterium]